MSQIEKPVRFSSNYRKSIKILFIFIDALGVGQKNPMINPCAAPGLQIFNRFQQDGGTTLPFGGHFTMLDATLGIPGRPQSATGHATLYTGVNAAKLIGQHKTGYPNQKMREMIFEQSLFLRLKRQGQRIAFFNGFPPVFFEIGDEILTYPRLSASTLSYWASGERFRNYDDIRRGQALCHDLTGQAVVDRGGDIPVISPEQAGKNLAMASQAYDYALFEYFLTDRAGHARDMDGAVDVLRDLEAFLNGLLITLDLGEHLVFLTSDHGGIEDLSIRNHTLNPVMAFAWGIQSAEFLAGLTAIEQVAGRIAGFLIDI